MSGAVAKPLKMVFGPVTAALFAELPRAQAGWLVKAMLAYAATGEAPEEIPPRHLAAWIAVREELAMAERTSAAKADAGRAGGSRPKQTQAEASKRKQTGGNGVLLASASENASRSKQTQADGGTDENARVPAGFAGSGAAEAPLACATARIPARACASLSDPSKERIDSYPESESDNSDRNRNREKGRAGKTGVGLGSDRTRDVPSGVGIQVPSSPAPSPSPAPVAEAPCGPSAAPCRAGAAPVASTPCRTAAGPSAGRVRAAGRNPGDGGAAMHREWSALAAAAESPYAVLAQVRDAMLPEFAAWSCMEGENTKAIAVYRNSMRSLTAPYFRRLLEEFLGECNTPGGEPESRGRAFMARIVSALRDVREQERTRGDRTLPLPMPIPPDRKPPSAAPPQPAPLPLAANQS